MGFGKRMTAKAWAWVRAFFVPRRSRVVNSGEEARLRNPGVVVRRRAARELWGGAEEGSPLRVSGAMFARRPRHDENNPVFDKIRQIHGLIPQIHAFIRQIQDPSGRGKNINSLKIKGLCEKEAPGGGISRGRGVCAHPPAFAPARGARPRGRIPSRRARRRGARQVFRRARRGVIMTMKSETSFAAYLRGWSFAVIPAEAGIQGWIVSPHRVGRRLCGFR